ncbi:NAD(P)-dependent oxidoreductase [Amycolatopsis sp. cg5]|uniref:NAD(P)-dependent oxidoreductase n=1 Tax=Amycolatopsis sp. cg5 TaxID=3238802 RepID=UPI003523AC82
MPTVALLGTGIMGFPMAANLARVGLQVKAWNRTRAKADPLAEFGVEVADSAAMAVADADIVVTMLADGPMVINVLETASPRPGAVLSQMSTVGTEWTTRIAALAGKLGVVFVDAPVLGTKQPAENGRLVVLVPGPEEAARVLDVIGSRTLWVGPAGADTKLKLVANAWVLALTNAPAESIGLAEDLGIDPNLFLEAIKGGGVDVPYAHLKGRAMIEAEFTPSFPARLALKDAKLVLDGASAADLAGAWASARGSYVRSCGFAPPANQSRRLTGLSPTARLAIDRPLRATDGRGSPGKRRTAR